MTTHQSHHSTRRGRIRLAAAALASCAGIGLAGCGEEEPAAEPATEVEAPAPEGAGDEVATKGPDSGSPRENEEPEAPEDGADPGTDASVEQATDELDQRIEQARELSDLIRESAEQLRETGSPGDLAEIAEQFGGPRNPGESPEEYCLRLGAPARFCEAVGARYD